MDKNKLLRAKNYFIKMKNDGLLYEDIIGHFTDIPESTLVEWREELDKFLKDQPEDIIKTEVANIDEKGEYTVERSLSFKMSPLDHARFTLKSAISNSEELLKMANGQELLANLIEASEKFDDLLTSLEIINKGNGEFNVNFRVKDDKLLNEAEKAVNFYMNSFFWHEIARGRNRIISNPTPDIFTQASQVLTFAIKSISIENFNGLKNVGIKELPVDAQWIFITGENSLGKSSLLQAIFIGLNGETDGDRILSKQPGLRIGIEYKSENRNIVSNLRSNFTQLQNLIAYGPSRLLIQATATKNDEEAYSQKHFSLFNPDGVLLNIEYNLILWYHEEKKKFDLIKDIFCHLIPHLEDIEYRQDEKKIYYKELNVEVEGFRGWLTFNQLASGTRSIIAMIGDLICRIYSINPSLEDPRNFSGIVLIDEIDVHLHPKLQKLFPSLLSECFPDIQFIATTHSVIPFLGAPLNSVFLKVSKTKGEGSVVTRLNLDIKNLLPNVLLTSSLFDMDSIAQVNSEGVQEIRTEDSYSEYLKNEELKKKLEDFEKGDQDFPGIN